MAALSVTSRDFGATPAGTSVTAYTLTNTAGMAMEVIDYGATIISVRCPSAASGAEEITLCHPDLKILCDRAANPYFGATVGRYANRIAAGEFVVDGSAYQLAKTFNGQHSHGGVVGWDSQHWRVTNVGIRDSARQVFVRFELRSEHLDEGYPGTVDAVAEYSLTDTNEIGMHFTATVSTLCTPINMCNHVYWNLCALKGDILEHELEIPAAAVVEVDEITQIPTGKLARVAGTAFDFSRRKKIGRDLHSVTGGEQVGYDHSFVIRDGCGSEAAALSLAAVLSDPSSKREMHVFTNKPCVHVYTTNFMRGESPFSQHWAVCLETQFPPDSPNQQLCGSCIFGPSRKYDYTTIHKFKW